MRSETSAAATRPARCPKDCERAHASGGHVMFRFIRRRRLALPALLIALGYGTAVALPAQAASTWSPPVQLPAAGCGGSVAVNASGAEVAAGYQQNTDNTITVSVCTSTDGHTWSGPVSLGQGVRPSVAIAPNGRPVAHPGNLDHRFRSPGCRHGQLGQRDRGVGRG